MNHENKKQFLESLFEFLRIQSISADPNHKPDILSATNFLKRELREIGFKNISMLYAKGLSLKTANPVIYAERLEAPGAPTVLIYGHYDVQPADPLELWKSPPFEPTLRNGKIFARGATDDKGQLYTHLAALKVLSKKWQEGEGKWPINIKIVIEGEEETNGENLPRLIKENPKKFGADICLVSDTGFLDKKTPAIEVGLRGIAYFELEVVTATRDLHSGLYGGAVHNPLNIISGLMAKLGQSKLGRTPLRKLPLNAAHSSFDIHGIVGGYQGAGPKTVIPNKASVKFSLRLTPDQSPDSVVKAVRKFIKTNIPSGLRTNLKVLGTGGAFLAKSKSSYLALASRAMEKTFGKKPVFTRSGGSIPIIPTIARETGAEVIMMGYGLPDDNLHSPNEKFDLDQFYKGMECNVEFLDSVKNHNN
jgi:acetylornithine deacetylase/succinyl-diaminopimelate desuccinylase-like protein